MATPRPIRYGPRSRIAVFCNKNTLNLARGSVSSTLAGLLTRKPTARSISQPIGLWVFGQQAGLQRAFNFDRQILYCKQMTPDT